MTVPARSTLFVALLGVLVLAASGCGETTIDDVKTEETLKVSLEKSLHEKIKGVDCPSGVKVEAGETFTCTVELPKGEEATATLKIRNSDADVDVVDLQAKRASAPDGASK